MPYVSHLLAVAGLVLEDGGSEDEAIAALLHDSIEDQGEEATHDEIERRFGERVSEIVGACTDADRSENLSSGERKAQHLAHLTEVDDEGVLRVVLADSSTTPGRSSATLRKMVRASGVASTPARMSSVPTTASWRRSSPAALPGR